MIKNLLLTPDNSPPVPQLMDNILREGGRGVAYAKGVYNYTPEEGKHWEETFTEFGYEIKKPALKYLYEVMERKMKAASPAYL